VIAEIRLVSGSTAEGESVGAAPFESYSGDKATGYQGFDRRP